MSNATVILTAAPYVAAFITCIALAALYSVFKS